MVLGGRQGFASGRYGFKGRPGHLSDVSLWLLLGGSCLIRGVIGELNEIMPMPGM